MKRLFLSILATAAAITAFAQGSNTGLGGYDGDYVSLAQRLANIEKKNDNFNLYLNFASSYQLSGTGNQWSSAFRAKQLCLEIKGQFGSHLGYRMRHRLNRSQAAGSESNFSKATDIMMVSWKFNDYVTVMGGKMCQFWGGFEFDENPMYIYQYSDMLEYIDCFLAGAAIAFHPWKGQEFVLNVTNSYSRKFADEYGANARLYDGTAIEAALHPLAYIFNWNGSFLNGIIQTRWGVGAFNEAYGYLDKMVFLGQKLNLKKFQIYFDWMSAWEGLDRLRIASRELCNGTYLKDVHYNSFVAKANWQFAKGFNFMAKGMLETATTPEFSTYRTSIGYIGSLEYYPMADQDFRIFAAYIGRNYIYNQASKVPGSQTNRIEIGLMYRIKAY